MYAERVQRVFRWLENPQSHDSYLLLFLRCRSEALHGWIHNALPAGQEVPNGTGGGAHRSLSDTDNTSTGYFWKFDCERSATSACSSCRNSRSSSSKRQVRFRIGLSSFTPSSNWEEKKEKNCFLQERQVRSGNSCLTMGSDSSASAFCSTSNFPCSRDTHSRSA